MKAIILAGGFGTRLNISTPKALLEVGGKPILSHILENVCRAEVVEAIIISTNEAFRQEFESYLLKTTWPKPVQLVIEAVKSESQKLGSIGAIQFLIGELCLSEDLLIIAGDNLFELDLSTFLQSVKTCPVIGVFDLEDKKLAMEYGVVKIDTDGLIREFIEKPEDPYSTLISTAIYYFPNEVLHRIGEYLSMGGSNDRLGDFISWLYKKEKVYAYVFSNHWFDIGSRASLKAANLHFSNKSAE